ncbi:MAG: carboxypeptidase-like regulatory domain-containing protein [Thioalkalivibrio sp.]|nr:carboxypeptidase-like regulatory domain-containing protein [Thioalkalivibrio sp.]
MPHRLSRALASTLRRVHPAVLCAVALSLLLAACSSPAGVDALAVTADRTDESGVAELGDSGVSVRVIDGVDASPLAGLDVILLDADGDRLVRVVDPTWHYLPAWHSLETASASLARHQAMEDISLMRADDVELPSLRTAEAPTRVLSALLDSSVCFPPRSLGEIAADAERRVEEEFGIEVSSRLNPAFYFLPDEFFSATTPPGQTYLRTAQADPYIFAEFLINVLRIGVNETQLKITEFYAALGYSDDQLFQNCIISSTFSPLPAVTIALVPTEAPRNDIFRQASLEGVIRDATTGSAVEGARIALAGPTTPQPRLSDASGTFTFSDLAAGNYTLTVSRSGYTPTITVLQLSSNPSSRDVSLVPYEPTRSSLSDDFDDGDFTSNPAWNVVNNDDRPGTVQVASDYVRWTRSNALGNGGAVGIDIAVDIPVSDTTAAVFDVLATFRDVGDGCGWTCGEFPANVMLYLENDLGEPFRLRYAFNYGTALADVERDDYRQIATAVPQGEWARDFAFTVRDGWPQATRITRVHLFGNGWNFDGGIDNVEIVER